MPRPRHTYLAPLSLAACLALTACLKEADIGLADGLDYLYVDGAVRIGEEEQFVEIGTITTGDASAENRFTDLTATLTDLTAGTVAAYVPVGDSDSLVARLPGIPGHAYRLDFTVDGAFAGAYASVPDSITSQLADLGVSTTARPLEVRDRDGNRVNRALVAPSIDVTVPEDSLIGAGLLIFNQDLDYIITDDSCREFDPRRTCYFDGNRGEPTFTTADLRGFRAGERIRLSGFQEALDWRFAELGVFSFRVRYLSAAGASYFRDLAGSVRQSGSLFAERALTPAGNVRAVAGEVAVLGNFSVVDERIFRIRVEGLDIEALAPDPLCVPGPQVGGPDSLDCCFCELTPSANTVRPTWWPD